MNLEWVFKNCILTFIAFTCKPEIQFIPLRSVGSTESTDACLTCIFAFWVRRKKKMTHAQEHAPPSTNSLCRLKQVSPKVAVFKNINGVKIKLIQTPFFSHAWPKFSWYTRKFGAQTGHKHCTVLSRASSAANVASVIQSTQGTDLEDARNTCL